MSTDASASQGTRLRRAQARLRRAPGSIIIRSSDLTGPLAAALMFRRRFAAGGRRLAGDLARHAPGDVDLLRDERYGSERAALLDLYRPAGREDALGVIVWMHGGGWFGGGKEHIAAYLSLIASRGFAVVAPRYPLAPEHRYPAPPEAVMQVLGHLQANADRLGIDPRRIVIGGDSAGAHIAAQIGALVTSPRYAQLVGVAPTIAAEQLRGLVLACGFYDLRLAGEAEIDFRRLLRIQLWAYAGRRDFMTDPLFATMSVIEHLDGAFPPALVTVGNADALRAHSEGLVQTLRALGHTPEAVFYPSDHRPSLGHEYQFELDTADAQAFLERMVDFLRDRLG